MDAWGKAQGFEVEVLTLDQERQGLGDRRYTKGDKRYLIEYKSDETASRTGNAFVETISVDTAGKLGWAFTCQADYIFYYLPLEKIIYIVSPGAIRAKIDRWKSAYPERPTGKGQNKGYKTWGLLVPLWEVEKCSTQVCNL